MPSSASKAPLLSTQDKQDNPCTKESIRKGKAEETNLGTPPGTLCYGYATGYYGAGGVLGIKKGI